MRARIRCAVMVSTSGTTGHLMQCVNQATHTVFWAGCGCTDPDEQICDKGSDVPECDGPHDYGA